MVVAPGMVVGSWRVQAWAGGGAYGAVYRAVPGNNEHGSPVALKLALRPDDPRFAREVELLSRCNHPRQPEQRGTAAPLARELAPVSPVSHSHEALIEDTLPEPQPGQVRPDEKGHCPRKGAVALNGGCWAETSSDSEGCAELGGQMFQGTCYVPFIPSGRKHPPTSEPLKKQ